MALGNNDNIIIQNNVNLDAELRAELDREKAKVKELTADVDRYIQQWREATAEVEYLNETIAKLESDSGVDVLKERINELTRATSVAAEEFEGFLRYANLIDEGGWFADDRLYEWFGAVKEGAITAGQAIANVKAEFGDFIRETMAGNGAFDSQMIQQFTATLSNLSQVITDIQSRLISMQENGVSVASGSGGLGGTFTTIDQIRASVESMSEEARAAYQPVTQLVEKIVELTAADSTKIMAVSQAFRGLAEFGRGSYSTSKINNIVDLIRQLHSITSSGNNVIRFEMTGVNDLHVSKASMRNLAEYLPTIASVNAAELEKLSHVNLTNFNDIKVSKVALDSIAQLRSALDQLSDAGIALLPPSADPEMASMIEKLALVKKLMTDINGENRKIQSGYSKAVGALSANADNPQNKTDLDTLNAKYNEYMERLTALRANKASASAEDVQQMHQEQAELEKLISEIQARIDAENAVTNAKRAQKEANAAASAELNARWEANGLTEGNIKSLFTTAEKNKDLFGNFEELRERYQEVIRLHEEWKRSGASTNESVTKPIEEATFALKGEIEATLELAAAKKKEEASESKRQALLKRGHKLLQQLVKEEQNWTSTKHGKSSGAYQSIRNYREALEVLLRNFESGEIAGDEFNRRLQEISKSAQVSSQVINANGNATKAWIDRVGGLASKFASWFSLTRVIMAVVRKIREMISNVVEIDSALGQLRIVTQASISDLNQYAQSIGDIAERTGASITDLIDSTTTYARLGYNLDQSSVLAEYTSMLSKVGAVDVQDAQSAVTAITKAFKEVDADDIESVLDKLVKVGNSFPISTAEISEGLNNAASALAASGNTFEKSVALLTAANTTVNLCRAA